MWDRNPTVGLALGAVSSVSALLLSLPAVFADAAETMGVGESISVEVIRAIGFWDYALFALIFLGLPTVSIFATVRWYRSRHKMTFDKLYAKWSPPSSFSGHSKE